MFLLDEVNNIALYSKHYKYFISRILRLGSTADWGCIYWSIFYHHKFCKIYFQEHKCLYRFYKKTYVKGFVGSLKTPRALWTSVPKIRNGTYIRPITKWSTICVLRKTSLGLIMPKQSRHPIHSQKRIMKPFAFTKPHDFRVFTKEYSWKQQSKFMNRNDSVTFEKPVVL